MLALEVPGETDTPVLLRSLILNRDMPESYDQGLFPFSRPPHARDYHKSPHEFISY
jgi:hypothetical protein